MTMISKLVTLCSVLLYHSILNIEAFSIRIPTSLSRTIPQVKPEIALRESESEPESDSVSGQGEAEGDGSPSPVSSFEGTSGDISSSVPEPNDNNTSSKSVTVDEGGAEQSIDVENIQTTSGKRASDIWNVALPIEVQGCSLRTWSFVDPEVQRVQVLLNTEGRPLHATIDLWQGPENTPQKMAVYIEDGSLRQFNAVINAPGSQNAIAIRNTAQMEFPLTAAVVKAEADLDILEPTKSSTDWTMLQGGSVRTYSFALSVRSVRIMLKSDGRPMNARIELLQGPNNNKQVVEIYTEDGDLRQFYGVLETPGQENVVRVVNTASVEFPLMVFVTPYEIGEGKDESKKETGPFMQI